MKGENKKEGFTIIELLTVLAIIALLVGILVPSMNRVRFFARNTRQQAQITAIDMALTMFRNDYGDYPPSNQFDEDPTSNNIYNGAQKLAEAMVGLDMLGFHPNSAWRADKLSLGGGPLLYNTSTTNAGTLNQRVGPYLEVSKANAFTLQQLFGFTFPISNTLVLCDTFKRLKADPLPPADPTIKLDAGMPILYFKANPDQATTNMIYTYTDNAAVINFKASNDGIPTADPILTNFYTIIEDTQAASVAFTSRPYRADSYILISAGSDGLYGTADDITNFGN